MATKTFINIAVKDLEKSKKFFTDIGFKINPQFTDQNAACVVFSEHIYAMLLTHETMKRFTKKEIADARKVTEVINTITVENREAVDALASKAIAAGGIYVRDPEDHGWMYGKSFEDPDGHQWEVFWIDEKNIPANPGQAPAPTPSAA